MKSRVFLKETRGARFAGSMNESELESERRGEELVTADGRLKAS